MCHTQEYTFLMCFASHVDLEPDFQKNRTRYYYPCRVDYMLLYGHNQHTKSLLLLAKYYSWWRTQLLDPFIKHVPDEALLCDSEMFCFMVWSSIKNTLLWAEGNSWCVTVSLLFGLLKGCLSTCIVIEPNLLEIGQYFGWPYTSQFLNYRYLDSVRGCFLSGFLHWIEAPNFKIFIEPWLEANQLCYCQVCSSGGGA